MMDGPQGYLGDIHRKTLLQLQELLQRQEKLLAKQKFLGSLRDKGEKIQHFTQRLRERIRQKEECDCSAHDMIEALSEHLQSLTVNKSKRKEAFKPNRTLKVSSMKDLPDNLRLEAKMSQVNKPSSPATEPSVPHRDCGQEVCFSEKPHEESAAHEPVYRFGKTKMISVEISIEIQRQQKEEMERLHALHAAERLAERLHIRIGDYSTSMPDMDYRSEDLDRNNDGEAEDSDDDHDDCAT